MRWRIIFKDGTSALYDAKEMVLFNSDASSINTRIHRPLECKHIVSITEVKEMMLVEDDW